MIIVIVNHHIKPGMIDAAARRIDHNGDRMSQLPGYLFRYRMVSNKDPLKISTITAWELQAHYDGWLQVRGERKANGTSPYESVDREIHVVEQADFARPKDRTAHGAGA